MTTTPRPAPQSVPASAAAPAPKPQPTFTISAVLDGFPVAVQVTGSVEQLQATIGRLQQLGAQPPVASWQTLPDGTPICPKHGVPMRRREKQGDVWYSHDTAPEGADPCYCKGYAGKDSPGWEQ